MLFSDKLNRPLAFYFQLKFNKTADWVGNLLAIVLRYCRHQHIDSELNKSQENITLIIFIVDNPLPLEYILSTVCYNH